MAVLALLLGLGADIFADGPSTLAIFSSLLAALAFARVLLICGPVLLYNLLAALFPKGGWVFGVLMAEGGGFEALASGTEYWFVSLHALAFLAALKIHGDHAALNR